MLTKEGPNGSTVLGEMAHMIADKPNGPRGDRTISEKYLRSYENLILLCADHHKIIDDDPQTYTLDKLRSIKTQHEAWVKTLDGAVPSVPGINISYVIIRGDMGLSELKLGRDSEVFGPSRYDFNLVYKEPLHWALELQQLSQPWVGYPPHLDWEALRTLGAPIAPLRPVFPLKRELARRGIDATRIIQTEFVWLDLGTNNCAGVGPLEDLASLDPHLSSSSPRWIAGLRAWILNNFETKTEHGELQALLPTIQVHEPLFYCLNVEANERAGKTLRLLSQGRVACDVAIDSRPVLVPLGCVFEDPGEEMWRIDGTECQMLDRDGYLSDFELSTSLLYSEQGFLEENMIGPRMIVDSFQIRDAAGRIVEQGDVRLPHKVKEYINCWFFGGSCPEIFYRVNSDGGWKYFGAALQGAIGPARARAETVSVADVRGGDRVEILILEVPGEVAFISVDVLLSPRHGEAELLQRCSDVVLTPSGRVSFDFISESAGRIAVRLVGYFERNVPCVDAAPL